MDGEMHGCIRVGVTHGKEYGMMAEQNKSHEIVKQEIATGKEMVLTGVETIFPPLGAPHRIEIPLEDFRRLDNIRQACNAYFMGVLPYCMVCKEPLRWHFNSDENILFSCGTCGRVWRKMGIKGGI